MKHFETEIFKKIPTNDKDGEPNGDVLPLFHNWNKLFEGKCPKFIYVTTVDPYSTKGPHLHKQRTSYLFIIKGSVELQSIMKGGIELAELVSNAEKYMCVKLEPNYPIKIINPFAQEAILINVAFDHVWQENDTDNYDVEDWPSYHMMKQ